MDFLILTPTLDIYSSYFISFFLLLALNQHPYAGVLQGSTKCPTSAEWRMESKQVALSRSVLSCHYSGLYPPPFRLGFHTEEECAVIGITLNKPSNTTLSLTVFFIRMLFCYCFNAWNIQEKGHFLKCLRRDENITFVIWMTEPKCDFIDLFKALK